MKKLNVLSAPPESSSTREEGEPRPAHVAARYWRSLAERNADAVSERWSEFPEGAEELAVPGGEVSRRNFFGLVGSGAALAGLSATTGCVRKPKENILPFSERPEDLVPGRPMFYASAISWGDTVEGVLVESQDGRPTKLEGNPNHPGSLGSTCLWTQATVLDLYDPDRSRYALVDGGTSAQVRGEGGVLEQVGALLSSLEGKGGKGLALVLPAVVSPTELSLLKEDFRQRFPSAMLVVDDALASPHAEAAAAWIGGEGAQIRFALERAQVVLAADCNIFGDEPESTRLAREWAASRRVDHPNDEMSRLYVVEPHLTSTGVMADHRRRVKGSEVGHVLLALAHALAEADVAKLLRAPAGLDLAALPEPELEPKVAEMVGVLARDLLSVMPAFGAEASDEAARHQLDPHEARRTGSAILVGRRQPSWVHALATGLNVALRNDASQFASVAMTRRPLAELRSPTSSLAELAAGISEHGIDTVIALGTNPAYDAPGALGLRELLAQTTLVHAGLYRDETGAIAKWHLPVSHPLEAWGDAVAPDGTITIRQPLIEPLHGTESLTELIAFIASGVSVDGYSLIKGHWTQVLGDRYDEATWRRWLHDGIASEVSAVLPGVPGRDFSKAASAIATGAAAPVAGDWEIGFALDLKVADGRFGNNAWLQELPDPITKLTWDNAACMSKASADALGVKGDDLVRITVDGRAVELPVFVTPGHADGAITVMLGYGRRVLPPHQAGAARVADGAGFDVGPLRSSDGAAFVAASVEPAGGTYRLASTQDYGSMRPTTGTAFIDENFRFEERPIALEATREDFQADLEFVERGNMMPPDRLRHLWTPPELEGPHQWGMSIDLNTCTACNACVVACQAENNIPVVGKEQVLVGREMHWIRLDRYFRGDEDDPTAIVQPMACQHCESAPCETVCPVAATAHSPEGLNDMAYNRCIGTRYCSNNCPYKVRRFNFFAYNTHLRPKKFWNEDIDGAWISQMQKNPDVTVRFRGVMEKCTYCVQRISQAKIAAHVEGKSQVADGTIVTACQQVCPTQAIVFGNLADPHSAVSRAKTNARDYSVLRDLNTRPRTTYLARIRNPHPGLPREIPEMLSGPPEAAEEHHGEHTTPGGH